MSRKNFLKVVVILCCSMVVTGWAQENIPVGTWRLHLSFNDLNTLAIAPNHIYAANDVGIIDFEKDGQEITIISKTNGLSGAPISALAYDEQRDLLLIAFENGLINLLGENKISVYSNLANSSAISGSRRINHITLTNTLAYLSTDFGVVVFDLDKREVKETYRDLSDTGENLVIKESVVLQDSIYLATEQGVVVGATNGSENLLDFRNWKRYSEGPLSGSIASITSFNGQVHVAVDASGIFLLQDGVGIQQPFLQTETFKSISGSSHQLLITTVDKVWSVSDEMVNEVGSGAVNTPDIARNDAEGIIWIADGTNGLLFVKDGVINNVKPNGPSSNFLWRITYSGDRILHSKGGFSSTQQPLGNTSTVDQFNGGQWSVLPSQLNTDITDQAKDASAIFIASFGGGLERIIGSESIIFDETNSPLKKSQAVSQILIPSIELSSDGVWVSNYGVSPSLHLLSGASTWESFSLSQSQAQYPLDFLVDRNGLVWMVIDPLKGGGIVVFDKEDNKSVYLTSLAGSGGLPSAVVKSISNDRDGYVWVGTDMGVVFFSNPGHVFNTSVDASRPIFENRFLLRDETVTAITVDGGNRKWLGTTNGVWLFDPTGEELIYNFTVDNSPLLSNNIISIAIDPNSGEVFFGTDKGMSSFRSAATQSTNQFADVKIFPNPISAEFAGQVAINGLYTNAIVKITDISGRLIWQTRANGGTAVWNARQVNGDRVNTGMYLVFATAEDGTERHVGKIAVIE